MEYKNILFINFGGIGDEILFLPTIQSIKEQYKNAKITLALESRSKSIKDLCPIIDDVICVDIKANGIQKYFNILKFIISTWFKNFDIVISSGKNPLIAIILFLTGIKERIGYNSKTDFLLTKKVQLNENQYAAKMYHDLLKPLNITNYSNPEITINEDDFDLDLPQNFVAIHPGVSKMSIQKNILKCPDIDFWLGLINGLLNKNKTVLLLGGPDDKDITDKILKNEKIKNHKNFINYVMKTKNLLQMAYIMKKANEVICVDSAPLHVAVGVKAKTYAIFGPTNEAKLLPKEENIELITNKTACRPCLWHKRNFNCENSSCLCINYELILDKIN